MDPVSPLICLVIALATTVPGTSGVQAIDITPRLHAGDEFRLEVVHLRERSVDSQQSRTSTTPVDVRVLTATRDGFTLEWTVGSTSSADDGKSPLVDLTSRMMRGVRLRLALTGDGKLAEVVNREQVLSDLQGSVTAVMRELVSQLPADQRPEMERIASQALSPPALLAGATREAEIYFGMNGTALHVGEPVEVEFERPNPFGGDPLPATFRVEAESATATNAVITTATIYDRDAVLELMRGRLEQQTGRAVSAEDGEILAKVQIADDGRYLLDRETGLMREVVLSRRVNAGDSRLDRSTIRLVDAPKR
jgi:hypothetical protein